MSAQPKWPDRQNVSRPGIVIWLKWTWSNRMTSPVSVQISPPSALSLCARSICCDRVQCMTRNQNIAEPFRLPASGGQERNTVETEMC